jgi:hypothetical protein
MRRREFVTGMGGAMMWPLAAHAQQTDQMRPVGVPMGLSEAESDVPARSVTRILVINPNSSQATTDMMVRIA